MINGRIIVGKLDIPKGPDIEQLETRPVGRKADIVRRETPVHDATCVERTQRLQELMGQDQFFGVQEKRAREQAIREDGVRVGAKDVGDAECRVGTSAQTPMRVASDYGRELTGGTEVLECLDLLSEPIIIIVVGRVLGGVGVSRMGGSRGYSSSCRCCCGSSRSVLFIAGCGWIATINIIGLGWFGSYPNGLDDYLDSVDLNEKASAESSTLRWKSTNHIIKIFLYTVAQRTRRFLI